MTESDRSCHTTTASKKNGTDLVESGEESRQRIRLKEQCLREIKEQCSKLIAELEYVPIF